MRHTTLQNETNKIHFYFEEKKHPLADLWSVNIVVRRSINNKNWEDFYENWDKFYQSWKKLEYPENVRKYLESTPDCGTFF